MTLNWQPQHLQNELIALFPLKEEDFEDLYTVASDPLVWEQHPNKWRYQREVFQNFFEGALLSLGAFLIRDKATNEIVGCSRFYDYDAATSSILIGYTFVGRSYWGKGFNRELKQLMLAYIFQYVDTVFFHIGAQNLRSQKAIEKIGALKVDEIEVAYYGEPEKINFVYEIQRHQISGL